MSWPAVEGALDSILGRRWYTNHGPLARALEGSVAETMEVRHAIAATNPTIALIMLAEALAPPGGVQLSALAPGRCVQALRWAGLEPGFRDLDAPPAAGPAATLLITTSLEAKEWADLAWDRGLLAFSDGLVLPGIPAVIRLPGHGDDAGAACVLTDDDALAARLRNIRSSYGAGPPVPVRRTANGRLSEIQAATTLLAWPPATPPGADRWRALPAEHRIGFGDGVGLVAATVAARDALLADHPGAVPWSVAAPPGLCPRAEALAARMALLPFDAAG